MDGVCPRQDRLRRTGEVPVTQRSCSIGPGSTHSQAGGRGSSWGPPRIQTGARRELFPWCTGTWSDHKTMREEKTTVQVFQAVDPSAIARTLPSPNFMSAVV